MADLYVSKTGSDTNPGTQEQPFRTILKASTVATPGTTVHVGAGTYNGGFQTTASGTPQAPIVYVSDTKGGAIIVPNQTPGDPTAPDVAWDNRGDNVVISGFQVDGGGSSWRIGLYSAGSNTVIEHNKVFNIGQDLTRAQDLRGGAGIYGDGFKGATNITIRNNEVFYTGPAGGTNLIHGIYFTTTGTITDNHAHHNSGTGIHLWSGARQVQVTGNTVHDSKSGIWVGSEVPTATADFMRVAGNHVHTNRMFGIAEGGNTGLNNSYVGNRVYGNHEDWRLQNGLVPTDTLPPPVTAAPPLAVEDLASQLQSGADGLTPPAGDEPYPAGLPGVALLTGLHGSAPADAVARLMEHPMEWPRTGADGVADGLGPADVAAQLTGLRQDSWAGLIFTP